MSKKKQHKKPRSESIYGTTSADVTKLTVHLNSKTGQISFGGKMTNVYSEVSYDRPKGPKVLSRIPQKSSVLSFEANNALKANFEYLCAVDTNTVVIDGTTVSVVGIVNFQSVWVPEPAGLSQAWQFSVPFCLLCIEVKSKPENFGWLVALDYLKHFGHVTDVTKIGMVVDSDLGNINNFNQRAKPVFESYDLPENVQLIYASADVSKDNVVNKTLAVADSVATQCINAVRTNKIPLKNRPNSSDWCESIVFIKAEKG